MADDQPPTMAGPANDATELLPPATQAAQELAWSADETVEIVHPSWRETYGTAAVIAGCCLVTAFVVGVVGWVLTRSDHVVPLPAGDSTPESAPASALPPAAAWTPTSGASPTPFCAPGHNSDRGCIPVVADPVLQRPVKTMEPTQVAAPPVTVAPKAPQPSSAELDERYLADLNASGLQITDVHTVIAGAHSVCRYLALGHSEPDAVQVAMHNNASLTAANARAMVDNAVQVYCPGQG